MRSDVHFQGAQRNVGLVAVFTREFLLGVRAAVELPVFAETT